MAEVPELNDIKLEVEGFPPGTEIVCRSMSLREVGEIETDRTHTERLMLFGDRVVKRWNLTVDGEELPASGEGMLEMVPGVAFAVYNAWTDALLDAPKDYAPSEANGA